MIDKRYQVFVSSTFRDLQDERQEVIQALLELDCMPAGMELFPAANEDQWTLIKKVIDDCDYYMVIVAGRYGSIGPEGLSYTEMEYRYALEQKKPVMAFVYPDVGKLAAERCESTEDGKKKLEAFRDFVQKKMCKFWSSPTDLGSVVSRSLVKLIKNNPAVGWVRGDLVPDVPTAEEILRLKKKIEELNAKLAAARTEAPAGTSSLAQGDDSVTVHYGFMATDRPMDYGGDQYKASISLTWNQIFAHVSPKLIDEITEQGMLVSMSDLVAAVARQTLSKDKELAGRRLYQFRVEDDDFQTIKVQLRALGLIARSEKPRSVKDTGTYWSLTPFGDATMMRLRAVAKASVAHEEK